MNTKRKRWTKEDDEVLKREYPYCEKEKLKLMFPNRTWGSIASRSVKELGLSRNLFDWKPEEDDILRAEYPSGDKSKLMERFPNRKWMGIQDRATRKLGLVRDVVGWNNDEIGILSRYYPAGGVKEVLKNLPSRSPSAIVSRASILGVQREFDRADNLTPLLSLNPTACYWLGLLFADGHFDSKAGACCLTLNKKDEETVVKFSEFISSAEFVKRKKNDTVSVAAYSAKYVSEICERFLIKSNKTENPPDISVIENDRDLMLSMLIGLIDGDGCIHKGGSSKTFYMSLMCHSSWYGFYDKFKKFVTYNFKNNGKEPNCHIALKNKMYKSKLKRYTTLQFFDYWLLKELKRETIRLSLPVMKRKWDKINLEYISERETTPCINIIVKELVDKGFSIKEVMHKTGYTYSRVRYAIKRVYGSNQFMKIRGSYGLNQGI